MSSNELRSTIDVLNELLMTDHNVDRKSLGEIAYMSDRSVDDHTYRFFKIVKIVHKLINNKTSSYVFFLEIDKDGKALVPEKLFTLPSHKVAYKRIQHAVGNKVAWWNIENGGKGPYVVQKGESYIDEESPVIL